MSEFKGMAVAVVGGYWKPELNVEVAPGAEQQFADDQDGPALAEDRHRPAQGAVVDRPGECRRRGGHGAHGASIGDLGLIDRPRVRPPRWDHD